MTVQRGIVYKMKSTGPRTKEMNESSTVPLNDVGHYLRFDFDLAGGVIFELNILK